MNRIASSILDALPPEGRLIVECISLSADRESRRRAIEQAARGVDWERLFDYTAGHSVIPAVHNALAEYADLVPSSTAKRLRFAQPGYPDRHSDELRSGRTPGSRARDP
jgi:hypothetical protein